MRIRLNANAALAVAIVFGPGAIFFSLNEATVLLLKRRRRRGNLFAFNRSTTAAPYFNIKMSLVSPTRIKKRPTGRMPPSTW